MYHRVERAPLPSSSDWAERAGRRHRGGAPGALVVVPETNGARRVIGGGTTLRIIPFSSPRGSQCNTDSLDRPIFPSSTDGCLLFDFEGRAVKRGVSWGPRSVACTFSLALQSVSTRAVGTGLNGALSLPPHRSSRPAHPPSSPRCFPGSTEKCRRRRQMRDGMHLD